MNDVSIDDDNLLQEKCGLVALNGKTPTKQLPLALLAAIGVQHRGTHGAGIAFQTVQGIRRYTGDGLLPEVFTAPIIKGLQQKTHWLMVHCRYGTSGGYNKENLQPCIVKMPSGQEIAVAHNGEFIGMHAFAAAHGLKFSKDVSDTSIFSKLLAQENGPSMKDNLLRLLSQVKGAYSLLIGTGNTLYVARDPLGIRPLTLGKIKDQVMVASETHAFDKIGATVIREVKRGEVLEITNGMVKVIQRGNTAEKHFCDFEWAYFSRPDSLLPPNGEGDRPAEWLSVSHFRERCGRELAREEPIKEASFIVGVPDSGVAVSTGYAHALRIPYMQMIVRDHFDPNGSQRLFMRDDQMKRIKKKVLGKLSLVPERRVWKDAIVVIGDDSIVRGNVSSQITHAAFAMGAREVHWIVGFPPVQRQCHLGVSIRTVDELIAAQYQGDVKKIARAIGATSIRYISPKAFVRARLFTQPFRNAHNPGDVFLKNGGCGGCVTGCYPIDRTGTYFNHS